MGISKITLTSIAITIEMTTVFISNLCGGSVTMSRASSTSIDIPIDSHQCKTRSQLRRKRPRLTKTSLQKWFRLRMDIGTGGFIQRMQKTSSDKERKTNEAGTLETEIPLVSILLLSPASNYF